MVLADRNSENLRNGRRSRGPSPSEQSSDISTDEESGEKIRVGREYQAIIPPLIPINERNLEECPDRALLVWSPTNAISDRNLDAYITIAKEKYGYNGEQALGMLFWHKHILQNAINDLPNFTPFPDDWTVEDKVLFEQAFQFHGKSFHRIRQMLPDKSIATLVKHYYSWKKTRCKTSLMDKHARKLIRNCNEDCNGSDAGSEIGSNTDSDSDEKKWINSGGKSFTPLSMHQSNTDNAQDKDSADSKTTCSNCGVVCTLAQTTSKGPLCNSCYTHWRRTGCIRPTVGPAKPRDRHANSVLARSKRKPPRGMYINHDDLVTLSTGEHPHHGGDAILKSMDRDIISLKRQGPSSLAEFVLLANIFSTNSARDDGPYHQIQNNKQTLSCLISSTSEGLGDIRPSDNNTRINARWTNEEMLLAVQGIRMHGKDFSTIAEIINTKTEAHLRSFYANQRKRYNLDKVVLEYEAEHGPIIDTEIKMEIETENTNAATSAPSSPTPKLSNSNKVSSK